MRARRYTPRMGAVETMEDFFEKLNEGDREGAVALMDEKTEMRVHVGDNAQTLRGVEQVGGWFLRADKGLRMIPGEIRDTGNTYEADLLVVRPGAPSQHLDATFRVEAGKITASTRALARRGVAGGCHVIRIRGRGRRPAAPMRGWRPRSARGGPLPIRAPIPICGPDPRRPARYLPNVHAVSARQPRSARWSPPARMAGRDLVAKIAPRSGRVLPASKSIRGDGSSRPTPT